jgi:hypothetical protein
MSTENQEPFNRKPNSILIRLSIISALPSLAIALWLSYFLTHSGGGAGLAAFPIIFACLVVQGLLTLPATLLVGSVYGRLSRRNQWPELERDLRFGIPLLVNILAPSTIFIISLIAIQLTMFHN